MGKNIVSPLFLVVLLLSTLLSCTTSNDPMIRCRLCGASVAKTSNYIPNPDPLRSREETNEPILHANAKVHTYRNPAHNEFEIATFSEARGDKSSSFTEESSFFDQYSWRLLSCSQCKHHIGWHFRHTDVANCYSSGSLGKNVDENQEKQVEKNMILESVLTTLEGTCVSLNEGWWTYRICHLDEIRQYHEESNQKVTMDWSLGKYNGEKVKMDMDDSGNQKLSYLYVGGQRCDENNDDRQTTVQIVCCPRELDLGVHIQDIKEPDICKYTITICHPQLCPESVKTLVDKSKTKESSSEVSKYQKECDEKFTQKHPGKNIEFYGIIWTNVLSDDSEELSWTKDLKTITALNVYTQLINSIDNESVEICGVISIAVV